MAEQNRLIELAGVYHADGGPAGEVKYVVGKLLGTAHCGLCDVTHATVRRRPAWDRMVARIGLPFVLLHLNEMRPDVSAAVREHGSPAVLGRTEDRGLELVLDASALDGVEGSVERFEDALREAIAARGRELSPAA